MHLILISAAHHLADIIRNSSPRFAIRVFWGWGIGKTTLMKMIEASLLIGRPVFDWESTPEKYRENHISNLRDIS
jgi:hypothetical protein